MKQTKKKILFISHCALRNGAPILLLNIGKLLKESGNYEIMNLLRSGGELEPEFSKLGVTFIWTDYFPLNRNRKIIQRILYRFYLKKIEERKINKLITRLRESDFIINNTITNGELLEKLVEGYNGKVISYIHELKMSTLKFASVGGVDLTVKYSHNYITPCLAVKYYLQNEFNISSSKISVLNSYIPQIKSSMGVTETRSINNTLVVGCSGTTDFRKGFDLFILLVKFISSQNTQNCYKFIWKGVHPGSELYQQGIEDIEKADLNDLIKFYPADDDMGSFYNSIDVFLLLSREDPYPLVVLEAASFGKPTICFDNAGGAPEFVQDDAGSVVPYLDIAALANELLLYQSNPHLISQKGNIAKERVHQKHQNKNIVLKQLHQILSD